MNVGERAHAWIHARIAEGATVYLQTHLKITKITPKTFASWADSGGLLKLDQKGNLFMRYGRKGRWDCIATPTMRLVHIAARGEP